jgi:NADP-dependent 3-hydroxy acid dehydrogenase YdfG
MSLGTAIIVGVGPGLGLALGRAFAEAGHSVALVARDKAKLDGYVAELASIGPEVRPYAADVTDEANLESAIATAILELGAPDLLVYNAGAVRMDKPTEGDAADLAYTLAVNVIGAKVAANAVRPALRSYVQTLHEELAGTGIHATSVAIYGQIGGPEPRFNPDTLAKDYVQLHRQPETEWQHELLRP